MTKEKAKEFLKYLHSLESDLKGDLFSLEQLKTIETIRFKFLEKYQESKKVYRFGTPKER